MQNAGVDESQARIKTSGRNISNLRYTIDTTLMAKSKELKNLLMKVKGESEKAGLKLNIQKTKIMASSTITSWQIAGEKMETVPYFIFLGSIITVDGASIHKIRHLFLGRKAMKKLDSVLKSKNITLPTKEQRYGFSSNPVPKWELDYKEGWVPNNWFVWIVVLEKTLESPLDSKAIKWVDPKANQTW